MKLLDKFHWSKNVLQMQGFLQEFAIIKLELAEKLLKKYVSYSISLW